MSSIEEMEKIVDLNIMVSPYLAEQALREIKAGMAQRRVYHATVRRGYVKDWTDVQFLARQVAKLQEELAELALGVNFSNPAASGAEADIQIAGLTSRAYFDRGDWSKAQLSGICDSDAEVLEYLKKELADMQVVVFNMAAVLGDMSRAPFDVAAAAVEKAEQDVRRGVR